MALRTLTEVHGRKLKDCGRYDTRGRPYWRSCPIGARRNRVVDGDMLKVDGATYRLWGIDSPEAHQSCADDWPAGRTATEHLRALISDRHITCEPRTLDHDGVAVAICRADSRDMVADGHAWAFVRYSRNYVEEEREAAAVRAGIHGHTREPVWRGAPERQQLWPISTALSQRRWPSDSRGPQSYRFRRKFHRIGGTFCACA